MSSPNGSQPKQRRPKAKKPVEIRWAMTIIHSYGEAAPGWVSCQMPITGPLRTVS
jgi:hypothetical protein